MNIHIDYRKGFHGREIELDEPKWRADSFGISNIPKRGTIDYEAIEELEEEAEQINYESNLSSTENLLSRVYGGKIEIRQADEVLESVEWLGEMPDDVQQYVEKVEESISSDTKGENALQIGRGVIRELI